MQGSEPDLEEGSVRLEYARFGSVPGEALPERLISSDARVSYGLRHGLVSR